MSLLYWHRIDAGKYTSGELAIVRRRNMWRVFRGARVLLMRGSLEEAKRAAERLDAPSVTSSGVDE